MNAFLFIGGPAVLLAILAWAADRFMPVPAMGNGESDRQQRKGKPPAQGMSAPIVPSPQTIEAIQRDLTDSEDLQEFAPLADALLRLGILRSKSMTEDAYPDPLVHKYPSSDAIELATQRITFQKDGKAFFEARS